MAPWWHGREDDSWHTVASSIHLDRRVRPVLANRLLRSQAVKDGAGIPTLFEQALSCESIHLAVEFGR
jgi:hypothetical protein